MYNFRIYFKFIGAALRSKMEYRTDFIAGISSVVIFNLVNLTLISILINQFGNLKGWILWELIFLYSFWLLCHSVYSMFCWHFIEMENYILKGTFDQFLIRPISPFIQFLGKEIHYNGAGDFIISIVFLSFSYNNLELSWGLTNWIFFFIFIISGIVIEICIGCILASISFWTGKSNILFNIILGEINGLVQQYPIDIFGKWFKNTVTFLIPLAFINYYPSLFLLDKTNSNNYILSLISPLTSLILLILSSILWRLGLRNYSSTGS